MLGGALGTDVLNTGGLVALTAGVAFQLYVASVNYAQNAPEGYNTVKDVRVSACGGAECVWGCCATVCQVCIVCVGTTHGVGPVLP